MRLAIDPAALAWAITPQGSAARAWLLAHDGVLPADALDRLRDARRELGARTGLGPGETWDLLEAMLARAEAVPAEDAEEYAALARRLVPAPCAPTLAIALALEVDALLAGDASFAGQDLVPVLDAWPAARQQRLP
ncbi:MAG: hypothetical protein LC624_03825 [Halobacteriales archaeon]|nr:hypothetical protein [Halobacteriales archaeon]